MNTRVVMEHGVFFTCLLFSGLAANAANTVTYNNDVLPILQQRCQTCHRPGETAPMSFLTYRETRPWAKSIRGAVLQKKMPPWFADPAYGKFSNDRTRNRHARQMGRYWSNRR